MINFSVNSENYKNDLMELVRVFEQRTPDDFAIDVNYVYDGAEMKITVHSDKLPSFSKVFRFHFQSTDEMERKRLEKRYLKIAIYRSISFLTGINLPYGCLTGIRPTKLYVELGGEAHNKFAKDFSVSSNKLALIEKTVETQAPVRNKKDNQVGVFVNIPFCPTRCAYCSFVSVAISKQKNLLKPYADKLCEEIELTKELVRRRKIKVRSIYIGGGTPTSLPLDLLEQILSHCNFNCKEFTVEAGRPDTITKEVLDVLEKYGVTRISVNPQTFNDTTLERIGRRHTAEDTLRAYELAKDRFDVNMDLIAALPNETFDDFKRTLDKAVMLDPANITVHTLYIKRGSELKVDNYDNFSAVATASAMVDYAYDTLAANGYYPYYMYRQKYTAGGLENVGYAKRGKTCVYNVDIMEEDTTILACGAGAISKRVTREKNLIEREVNFKEPKEYVERFDEVIKRTKDFWHMR